MQTITSFRAHTSGMALLFSAMGLLLSGSGTVPGTYWHRGLGYSFPQCAPEVTE